jgi:predicted heme/steroid binding protein/uncharacterized membrane protein
MALASGPALLGPPEIIIQRHTILSGRHDMIELSVEELSRYDGKEGRPVYVAHQGKVYDVSKSPLWKTGVHMKRHASGRDLSVDIGGAPHGPEVLERCPQVGTIRPEGPVPSTTPAFLERLFELVPMLRRHPHPMTVHFPIVFMLAAPFFTLLYLATGRAAFETTAFHCLTAGVLFMPLVMLTGFVTWWVNYMAKPVRPIRVKIKASLLLLGFSTIAYLLRAAFPDILHPVRALSAIYLMCILTLPPLVMVIGWFGANLTFPVERD